MARVARERSPGARAGEPDRRRRAILEVVERRAVASQAELQAALARAGFRVTQATLSRDLKALRVSRVPTAGGYRYAAAGTAGPGPAGPADARRAASDVLAVEGNEVSVVLRTPAGRAQGVGVFLDGLRHRDVLGTLAGDDTVLVLPRSVKRAARLRRALRDLFGVRAA
jgi:transcriptional regulator of arginine metabolism